MMWGPYGMGYGGGWMPLMGIFWLVILFLVAAALMGYARGPWSTSGPPEKEERRSAGLAILEERYARGEIGRDEYLQKKQDMTGRGGIAKPSAGTP